MKIISAFPGIGKTYFYENCQDIYTSYDSDSSNFDKKDFPNNYIQHIKELIHKNDRDILFVSSHEEVRKALIHENIPFTCVYPSLRLKATMIGRYFNRFSPMKLIKKISENYDQWVKSMIEYSPYGSIIIEDPNKFLSHVIDRFYSDMVYCNEILESRQSDIDSITADQLKESYEINQQQCKNAKESKKNRRVADVNELIENIHVLESRSNAITLGNEFYINSKQLIESINNLSKEIAVINDPIYSNNEDNESSNNKDIDLLDILAELLFR